MNSIEKINDYSPPIWLRNGHIGTVYPFFFRSLPVVKYRRKIKLTPDGDHFAIDNIRNKSHKIAYILHGLEGSVESQYVIGMSKILLDQGWDISVINYRGCGGLENKKLPSYHSGATADIHQFLLDSIDEYDTAVMIGFSLGGNLTMKYLGDGIYPIHPSLKTAVAISTPVDLSAGSDQLNRLDNKGYTYRFLKSLLPKVKAKMKKFPGQLDEEAFHQIKTLRDFDDFYTGPVHGFEDAEDYYQRCSCGPFIKQIPIPTVMINALNDPFIPTQTYPISLSKKSKLFTLITPKHGGHVGFHIPGKPFCWQEYAVAELLKEIK